MHEVQDPVVGAPESVLGQHRVRVTREVAIGEKEQLDIRYEVIALRALVSRPLGAGVGGKRSAATAKRLSSYVSHVDIFAADCYSWQVIFAVK